MRRAGARVSVRWQLTVLAVAVSFTGLTTLAEMHGAGAAILNYTGTGISSPQGMTTGPDGALWFTNTGNNSIGRITPSGTVTNFTGAGISNPQGITSGSDGNLWFTNEGNNSIGRITPGGTVSNFTGLFNIYQPNGITAGPDGALWFTNGDSSIGKITTGGTVSNFVDANYPDPQFITAGPDGALWYTCANGSIDRMTTAGVVTGSFTDATISSPAHIASGPDGALWFANTGNDSIGRITTGGTVTHFVGPNISHPYGITVGPDGALWFTSTTADSIGRITTGGAVTKYTDPSVSAAQDIAAGPDGAMWFPNGGNSSIGSLPLSVPGAPAIDVVKSALGSIAVTFTPGADGSPSTTGYVASCHPTGLGAPGTASGAASPIVVSGLTNGRDYSCTVRGVNVEGNGPASAPSGVVSPSPTIVTLSCRITKTCAAAVPSTAAVVTPGQTVQVSGVPSSALGSIKVSTSLGTLACPAVGPKQHRITNLTDKGFSAATRLQVSVTLHIASATKPEGVCFNSDIAFKSQEHPKVKTAGTGMLLSCTQVGNVAPCVTSSKQVGVDIVVKFVVPGGDPRFFIALPRGRQAWLSGSGTAKVGTNYSVHVEAAGGKAPFHWKVASGKPPAGLALNKTTGVISGKPTKRGTSTFTVQATDSAKPAQAAKLNVPMSVK